MRIVPFPQPDRAQGEPTATELEAALHGDAVGPSVEHWCDLRADVRSLAPPISAEFERELRERITQRAAPAESRRRSSVSAALARLNAWLGTGTRARLIGLAGVCAIAALLAVVIVAPWRASEPRSSPLMARGRVDALAPSEGPIKAQAQMSSATGAAGASAGTLSAASSSPSAASSAPGRVQQRAAAITLAAQPEAVQSVSDRVAQLTVREGGFVQSSQVHLERGTAGEASLRLSLPSEHLSTALASLERLAPTRAESQSLQDITDEYGAAQRKLSDAVAERQALLRALARAATQGQIESLHARLSLAGGAIARASSAFQSVSKRAGNSAVEVTVLGDAHAGNGSSTLSTGLHDAGDVLKVALAVLIVALAVLVPLALLSALVAIGWRTSRRRLRERALS